MEETTSAVAEVTSIKLGRRWRLIYFGGKVGEERRPGGNREVAGFGLVRGAWQRMVGREEGRLRIRSKSAGNSAVDGDRQPSSPSEPISVDEIGFNRPSLPLISSRPLQNSIWLKSIRNLPMVYQGPLPNEAAQSRTLFH